MKGYIGGTVAFPTLVRPEPILRSLVDSMGKVLNISRDDSVLWHSIGLVADGGEKHLVMTAAHLGHLVIYDWHVVLPSKVFGTIEEGCLLVHKQGPEALVLVAW